jgi:hypothetical protein
MRRLVCSAAIHLPTAGAHACPHACCPRRFFGFSPLCPIVGLGRCHSSAPARFFGGEPR